MVEVGKSSNIYITLRLAHKEMLPTYFFASVEINLPQIKIVKLNLGQKYKSMPEYQQENKRLEILKKSKDGNQEDASHCKYCSIEVSARTDRVKECVESKRHKKLKEESELRDKQYQELSPGF